jgi:hypothetical protein
MRRKDFELPPAYEISIAEVAWEYFNGTGWALLPVDDAASTIFSQPSPEPRSRRVAFTCPDDLKTVLCGAHDLPFIRARIVGIKNFGRTKGHFLVPRIELLRFRYYYHRPIFLTDASVEAHGETRVVQFASPLPLLARLKSDPVFYLGFDRPIEDASILFALRQNLSTPQLTWEFCSNEGWTALDVHDGSDGLAKTGIVVLHASQPVAESRVMGIDAHFIRLVDVNRTLVNSPGIGPQISGIWLNAVKARACTPGVESNRAPHVYRNLVAPLHRVNAVYNPLSTRGGSPAESETEFIERVTARFNNLDRAVTASDFEQLAQASSRQVLRCACLSNIDEQGVYSFGHTCAVILSRDEDRDNFEYLAQKVAAYLEEHRSLAYSGPLAVVAPHFVEVCVNVHLLIGDLQDVFALKHDVLTALEAYLDPRYGDTEGRGFAIGSLPDTRAIEIVLRQLPSVLQVVSLDVSYLCESVKGTVRRSYANAVRDPFVLPVSGTHNVSLGLH